MSGFSIKIEEDFINKLIDKVIEENISINGLKNLNIEMKEDGMHFQVEVSFLDKNVIFDTLIEFLEKPKSLADGILKLSFSGDEGIRKIIEGVFSIFSKFIDVVASNNNEVIIDFSKIKYDEKIQPIFNSIKIKDFEIKNKEFRLNLIYEE
ncbi:hypothetical protein [Marinitoga litoralis]|jgi:hypothetical protein|uniref:hypothetical protein n=1 Tax=Marinitoga litoralis TaxID=570855 RepID=UPI00195FB76E|nr:hypothetical protein [Marinitoga litoralis]MBM7558773.1 hypothetical protein [Marinitoga litoralis]